MNAFFSSGFEMYMFCLKYTQECTVQKIRKHKKTWLSCIHAFDLIHVEKYDPTL